jgi:hypothetical protein
MTRRSLSLHSALLAGYHLLAIVHTYPLVRRFATHLPGAGLGDNVSFVWNGWWMREALASSSAEFLSSAPIQAPLFPSLILHTHNALGAFLGATLLAPLSLVEAQNVVLVVSLALNGMGAYALAWTVSGARVPSMLAGALFVVSPVVAARLMSHFNLVMVWPLAFACAACVRWWRTPSFTTAAMMAATAALIPYADYYYAVFFGVFALAYGASEIWTARVQTASHGYTPASLLLAGLAALAYLAAVVIAVAPGHVWRLGTLAVSMNTSTNALTIGWLLLVTACIARWRPRLHLARRAPSGQAIARSLLFAVALFVALLVPLIVPAFTYVTSGDYVTQASSLKSSPRGIDLATVVLGPPFNGLLGPLVREAYSRLGIDVMETSAWIGVGLTLLLAISVRGADSTRELRRWLGMTALFAIWALGPYLTVLARNTGILLPQAAATIVPIINNARIPGRALMMVALVSLVVLVLALSKRQRPVSPRLVTILAGLAVLESIGAPLPLAAMPSPGVYADIAAVGRPGAVLPIPFGVRDGFGEKGLLDAEVMLGQTFHGHPLVGGFLARLPPGVWSWYEQNEPYRTLLALSADETSTVRPSCRQIISGLRAASVDFVVLYPARATAAVAEFVTQLPLRRVSQDDHRVLFAVDRIESGRCGTEAQ